MHFDNQEVYHQDEKQKLSNLLTWRFSISNLDDEIHIGRKGLSAVFCSAICQDLLFSQC